jgi:ABC-2 type transport system permease protein
MVALSGLFFPIDSLPGWARLIARILPLGYAVSLLDGIWRGEPWSSHLGDVAALTLFFVIVTAIASRVFRWE